MAYLTDKEKRLLFSALTREKKVCVEVDKEYCREPYEDTLESIVKNLEKKFYYDRFEKEIRAKAIDDYMNALCDKCMDMKNECYQLECPFCSDGCAIVNIAEQLKEGGEHE